MTYVGVTRWLWIGFFITAFCYAYIQLNAEAGDRIFWHLLKIQDELAAVIMMLIFVAGAGALKLDQATAAVADRVVLQLHRYRFHFAFVVWVVLLIGTRVIYKDHPLAMDEYAALFQAKIFASGAIHGQYPPERIDALIPPVFQGQFLVVDKVTGEAYSAYWPGFSLVLASFVAAGAPWACNPTIVAASLLLICRIVRDLGGSPTAVGWALLFAIASPAFLINGMSYYSMPAHLLLNLTFVWLLMQPSPARLLAAGAVGGLALCLHNPLPHLAFAFPWLVWLATKGGFRRLALVVVGYLPVFGLLGAGWALAHSGMPLAGITMAGDASLSLPERGVAAMQAVFSFLKLPDWSIVHARVGGLIKLWLWASPILLILAVVGFRRLRLPHARLLGISAVSTLLAYFVVRFDQGHGWGYRYFHSAWGVLPVLAALAVTNMGDSRDKVVSGAGSIFVATVLGLALLGPLRAWQVEDFISEHLEQRPPMAGEGPRVLVFTRVGYYGLDLVQNDPWMRGPTVSLLAPSRHVEQAVVKETLPNGFVVRENRFGRTYASR